MTAIYGLWRFDGGDVSAEIKLMDSALALYGSDECEIASVGASLSLGRRLHRSVPEDRFPTAIASPGRYAVVADVRLTEREDLAEQLGLGRKASTMSDAALAAAALEAWNEQAFDRIYGSFAIAAWDKEQERLLLARDPLGQKPLFFHSSEDFFVFASMPRGLHALPRVPRGADLESIKRFLALQSIRAGETYYESIGRVMPGHYVAVTRQGRTDTRYWHPDLSPLRLGTHEQYVEALREHLDRAVGAALRGAEEQVGAHLSSGFDSTTVATTAARLLARSGGKVVAYTAAPREGYSKTFPHRGGDESILASATARMHPNMDHVIIRSSRTPMENIERTASIYAVPVFNICNQTWYDAINDNAAERGITVMLEAPMGNTTISETGVLALPELFRSGRLASWFSLSAAMVRRGSLGIPAILWKSVKQWVPDAPYRWLLARRHGPLASSSRFSALKAEHLQAANISAASDAHSGSGQGIPPRSAFRSRDNSVEDRLAALAGDDSGATWKGRLGEWKIDYRDPTADRRLVEFSLRVPVEQLIHEGQPRALLREVLADRVPREVLDNPARGYQLSDWHELLDKARPQLIEEISRMEAFEPSAEIMDVTRLKALLDNWPERGSDEWIGYAATVDYRCCLLRAISASTFMRHAAGAGR
jgi:asparagine synthase (glutamine-hydrolysing)